jgi:glucose/arabinose dehydrogenase
VLVAACGGSDEPEATTTTTSTTSTTAAPSTTTAPAGPDLDAVAFDLTKVGTFDQPLAMTWCPGRPQPYVAEKTGKVKTLDGRTVIDISGNVSTSSEQGLLGIACDPKDGTFYFSYTDRNGDSFIDQMQLGGTASAAHVLRTDQPAANHNGGNIAFGPDGLLWYGLGDGGGADDRFDNAQRAGQRLGSIMRLNPVNPVPEILVKGVRNPWRWSFDRKTEDLWIGDVGQNRIEEIDKLTPDQVQGANLGWSAFEGTERFRRDVPAPAGAIPPVFQYDHSRGSAVVGGYVYRGTKLPALVGAYVFADTYEGILRLLVVDGTKVVGQRDVQAVPGKLVSSFAEDPDGELYILSLAGGVYRLDP